MAALWAASAAIEAAASRAQDPSRSPLTLHRELDDDSWESGLNCLPSVFPSGIRMTPVPHTGRERQTRTPVTEESDTASVATETDLAQEALFVPCGGKQEKKRSRPPSKGSGRHTKPKAARLQARLREPLRTEVAPSHVLATPIATSRRLAQAAKSVTTVAKRQTPDPEAQVNALIERFVEEEIDGAKPAALRALSQQLRKARGQLFTTMQSYLLEEAAWKAVEHADVCCTASFEAYGLQGDPQDAADLAAAQEEADESPSWDEISPHLRAVYILADITKNCEEAEES